MECVSAAWSLFGGHSEVLLSRVRREEDSCWLFMHVLGGKCGEDWLFYLGWPVALMATGR